uniref:Uncharacterized protein n=1 Tax=Rhizophagus irregularis (strain DAOM 181602 / DAOM 197198 / MUCL 43194) TaxID=747089 RepID=U9TCP2_RHIID
MEKENEPKLPLIKKANIVVKFLDSEKFPTLTKYANQMIRDMKKDNILSGVIGHDIIIRVVITVSNINIGDIIPKESYIYAMILLNNHYLMSKHIVIGVRAISLIMILIHYFFSNSISLQATANTTPGGIDTLNRFILFEQF